MCGIYDVQPAELDAVKSSPASMETLWKLVEIPFMHQAKCVLRFIKKLPGITAHCCLLNNNNNNNNNNSNNNRFV